LSNLFDSRFLIVDRCAGWGYVCPRRHNSTRCAVQIAHASLLTATLLSLCAPSKRRDSIAMLIQLLLLSLASFGSSRIISPRQNLKSSSTTTVTVAGNGLESATACINSKLSWASDKGTRFASSTVLITSWTYADKTWYTDYETTTSLKKNGTAYTLCDKWPRIDGSTSIIDHSYQLTTSWTSSFISTVSYFTPYPAPNCTILKPECDILESSYSMSKSSYLAAWSSYREQLHKRALGRNHSIDDQSAA
jgi:hypothetical protein